MAISPIGNITYINQNTQANVQNIQNRIDTTPINIQEFEDKINDIQETRATEETHIIDKDSQGNGQTPQQQHQETKKQEDEALDEVVSTHLLDIKA